MTGGRLLRGIRRYFGPIYSKRSLVLVFHFGQEVTFDRLGRCRRLTMPYFISCIFRSRELPKPSWRKMFDIHYARRFSGALQALTATRRALECFHGKGAG